MMQVLLVLLLCQPSPIYGESFRIPHYLITLVIPRMEDSSGRNV